MTDSNAAVGSGEDVTVKAETTADVVSEAALGAIVDGVSEAYLAVVSETPIVFTSEAAVCVL